MLSRTPAPTPTLLRRGPRSRGSGRRGGRARQLGPYRRGWRRRRRPAGLRLLRWRRWGRGGTRGTWGRAGARGWPEEGWRPLCRSRLRWTGRRTDPRQRPSGRGSCMGGWPWGRLGRRRRRGRHDAGDRNAEHRREPRHEPAHQRAAIHLGVVGPGDPILHGRLEPGGKARRVREAVRAGGPVNLVNLAMQRLERTAVVAGHAQPPGETREQAERRPHSGEILLDQVRRDIGRHGVRASHLSKWGTRLPKRHSTGVYLACKMSAPTVVGLCQSCRWMRRVTPRRGGTFFRCSRAETDSRFVRYPPLPVLECVGYEAGASSSLAREDRLED